MVYADIRLLGKERGRGEGEGEELPLPLHPIQITVNILSAQVQLESPKRRGSRRWSELLLDLVNDWESHTRPSWRARWKQVTCTAGDLSVLVISSFTAFCHTTQQRSESEQLH
ncbi:hypothetical protein RRG08_033505 [Elysia crispata]|uniref:Uncharacterized protein n=1 Tax=Elysia crispata TaxID=231223 RepID=A0AAE1AUD8_9GAST|nr:hypothetical protein RRG08_033505 [Elysia crispata]